MRIILSLFITGFTFIAFSQTSTSYTIPKKGMVKIKKGKQDWAPSLRKHKHPTPDGQNYQSELKRRKTEMVKKYPRTTLADPRDHERSNDSLPIPFKMFEGNAAGNGTPNDNNLAVSNSGYMVSVVNSNIYFFDVNADTLMYEASLGLWTIDLYLTNQKFDPKVIYDPEEDRFVVVFLHGTGSLSSQYIACFSTSDNPMDPWNMYELPGNPFNDTSWSDYPALALSGDDLFLTINLLTPGHSWQTGFKQSLIWQIDKMSGYNGDSTLNAVIWSDIVDGSTNIRNLHPVRNARGQLDYQNYCYFLSNKNFALESDTIYLIKIDGGVNYSPTITVNRLHSDVNYYLTVDAPEPGGQELATNDNRILGAVHEKDVIQFVQNSIDTSNGNSAIYHGFIDLINNSVTGNVISDSVLNLGYPNIAGLSNLPGGQESMISFEYSSEFDFPGYAAVYYDGNSNYSDIKILKQGENRISVFNDPLERWGDYSGIQRIYNDPCKVWCCGTYGKTTQKNGTWIAQIGADSTCAALPLGMKDIQNQNSLLLYPNPVKDYFSIDFESSYKGAISIEVYGMNGQCIQHLMDTYISTGEYRFNFNALYLDNGVYFLLLTGKDGVVERLKFVINR